MLGDGLGRVRSSVLVAIDADRSACALFQGIPEKLIEALASHQQQVMGGAIDQSGRQDVAAVGR